MEPIDFLEICRLAGFEAVYRRVAAMASSTTKLILTREMFARGRFAVLVDCDDIFELARRGKPVNLVFQKPAQSHGAAPARRVLQ
jgi:hypothetical protein